MNLKLRLVTFFSLILFANSFVYANKTNHIQTIHLGSGCFWGAEKDMNPWMELLMQFQVMQMGME